MGSKCLGGVVVGDVDGTVADSDLALESVEEVSGQMLGVPLPVRMTKALPELVDSCLRNQGEVHLAVPDVEVHCAGAIPAERLLGVEELFDMPSPGIIDRERFDLVPVAGRHESFEVPIIATLFVALDQLMVDTRLLA